MAAVKDTKKTTIRTFFKKKAKGEKIAMLTAYDWFIARLLDQEGVDSLLVGDTAGHVIHGFDSTLPVTMDIMITHTAAVARGAERALIIGDMPFMSFQPSAETAIRNAGRFLQEGGAAAVKVEGGLEMVPTIRRLIESGIPVVGHIGLTPQSINIFGGPRIQGRTDRSKNYLIDSALALEEAGCFSIVLELVESGVAAEITSALKRAPTIGIGAGPACDGQVLVINDILGLRDPGFKPKFLREYADLSTVISDAARQFISDVRSGSYPSDEESHNPE